MQNDTSNSLASYWFEGYADELPGNVVFRSFVKLPWSRKPIYLLLLAICTAMKVLLAVTDRLGIRPVPSLCDGLEYPPRMVPLETYGQSQEEVARGGGDAQHYLDESQISQFERDGFIGPFRAMSPEQAEELRKATVQAREGKPNPAVHHDFPALRELWKNPAVAYKIASLLGEDPKVWRSQFFAVPPKTEGTFWHQATTFREHNNQPAVTPAEGREDNIAQLTVWCALTPAKQENACMKFLAGSQRLQIGVDFANNVRYKALRVIATLARWSFADIDDFLLRVIGQSRIAGSIFPIMRPMFRDFLRVYGQFYEQACRPVTMEMEPGEFVIFTSATLHGSWPNESDETRVAYAARTAGTGAIIHDDYKESTMSLFGQNESEAEDRREPKAHLVA